MSASTHSDANLQNDDALARSEVVANAAMNRERNLAGPNSYARDLGFDVWDFLQARRRGGQETVRWLDLCCGTGRALIQTTRLLAERTEEPGQVAIVGVDLVPLFDPVEPVLPPFLTLTAASLADWQPDSGTAFDLITCVHGLHYIGDKLDLLARAASWLAADGVFLGHLDLANVRIEMLPLRRALREAGFHWDSRRRIVRCDGQRRIVWPFRYLGADDTAGPNFTGQPAVDSFYVPI